MKKGLSSPARSADTSARTARGCCRLLAALTLAPGVTRRYFLTFMIAYIRDFGMEFRYLAESFETTVPWSNVVMTCDRVKKRVAQACKDAGVEGTPFLSCRVTQTYDTAACIYFYFGFSWKGLKDPRATFTLIEDQAREEILACGGSLSHHHGIGKHRQPWYPAHISKTGVQMMSGIKAAVDPRNIFANGNLITPAPPPRQQSRL
jgi:alkyldihydroxyacetonephosphate synthase